MFVCDIRFIFTKALLSLVRRFPCENQGKSCIPEKKISGDGSDGWSEGSEAEDDDQDEQRIAISRIHCLFTVIHCSWGCSKTCDSCKPLWEPRLREIIRRSHQAVRKIHC